MAAAPPYAIGIQRAYSDRQVVAFTGDGSAAMLMGESSPWRSTICPLSLS